MIVADLSLPDLDRRLRRDGLRVRTGPVVVHIQSQLRTARQGIALHYAQHPIESVSGFADFHISVDRSRAVCRWLNQQVVFRFDGTQPLAPLLGDQGFVALEHGLDWCVASHCHQYLIVRAAVLERGGRALLLPAPSGSGKSTLCAGLVFGGGWRLLSDELALINPANGHVVALPRPVRLKDASINVVRDFAPTAVFGDVVHATTNGQIAYARPPADAVLHANEHPLPAWVVVPHFVAGAAAQMLPLSQARAFMALVDNAFNYNIHGRIGFAAFATLIDRSACLEFTYSDLREAITVFDQLARSG